MNTFDAVMIAEGVHDSEDSQYVEAWQHLIDTGVVWQLQGWFGRQANILIENGTCTTAEENNED